MAPIVSVPFVIPATTGSSLWMDHTLPPIPGVSIVQDGFMMTSPSPAWRTAEDFPRHPLWMRQDEGFSYPSLHVVTALAAETAWSALLNRLTDAGWTEERAGGVDLRTPVQVRGAQVRSTPIDTLADLQWFLTEYREKAKMRGAVVEPVALIECRDEYLWSLSRRLSAKIAEGAASEGEREVHRRAVRILIQRTSAYAENLLAKHASK